VADRGLAYSEFKAYLPLTRQAGCILPADLPHIIVCQLGARVILALYGRPVVVELPVTPYAARQESYTHVATAAIDH